MLILPEGQMGEAWESSKTNAPFYFRENLIENIFTFYSLLNIES
jgi:hypothetical protein